jgi:hypothetical protein
MSGSPAENSIWVPIRENGIRQQFSIDGRTTPRHALGLAPACTVFYFHNPYCDFIISQPSNQTSTSSPSHSIKMATDNSGTGNGTPPRDDSGDAIAIAIRTQTSLATSFHQWLAQKMDDDGDRNGIIVRVQSRLDSYKQWLLEVDCTPINVPEDVEPWSMSARVRSGDEGGSAIIVTGLGSGEPIDIATKDKRELGYLMSVCIVPP